MRGLGEIERLSRTAAPDVAVITNIGTAHIGRLGSREAIATALQDSVLPGLKQHIVSSRVTTPQDFQDRLWSFKGAGFGLEPVITQSAWFRPHNRSEDIPNLFLVGAGTQPGAGVPSVLMSAKMLEQVVPHALTVY